MSKIQDFKFGVGIHRQAYKPKNAKIGQKGVACVTWPTFIILWPLHISGTGIARDFKFRVLIDRQAYKPKIQK